MQQPLAIPHRIALFGGTFDPPHDGHLMLASDAVRVLGLSKVIFIPCHQSPHKAGAPQASDEARKEMLALATHDLPWAEVSPFEIDQGEPSYSYKTAEHFAGKFPEAELCWILGADQWQALEKWKHPEKLAKILTFIVFPRHGLQPLAKSPFRAHFIGTAREISATEIREKVRTGQPISGLVPSQVEKYIKRHHIYQA